MDAAEALAGFALPSLHASARMDARDEPGGRSASAGTGREASAGTALRASMSVEPQPDPCGRTGCSGQAQRPVSKRFRRVSVSLKNGTGKEKLGLRPYLEMPAGCKYFKVALLKQNGF